MHMSIEEFERKFFNPAKITKFIEERPKWVEQYRQAPSDSTWTTYFMLLGALAAAGRLNSQEFQTQGPATYAAQTPPTPERMFTLTVLVELLKE